jgi:RNA polymerase sigma-70 factor (ECF subfamily)
MGARGSGGRPLTSEEFAVRYQEAARVLWTIAAGVLGDPSEAEDVLQDAALMALQKLEQFEPGTRFDAWMASFVRNVALNHARKRRRRSTESVDPSDLAEHAASAPGMVAAGGPRERLAGDAPSHEALPIGPGGELLVDQAAFDDRLTAALHELGPTQRSALLLRTVLALEYREISALLGVPEGTAMSHVHRARTALRDRLGDAQAPQALGGDADDMRALAPVSESGRDRREEAR